MHSDPEHWVDLHGDALFRFALLRVGGREIAEELVQETFLAALRSRESFGGRSSERTWLIGILKRKIVDHFRKLHREHITVEGDERAAEIGDFFTPKGSWKSPPGPWKTVLESAEERREFWTAFGNCLLTLPRRLADAFCLRELGGLEVEEVCQVLNVSPTNLWVQLYRARMLLRRCLETSWLGRSPRREEET